MAAAGDVKRLSRRGSTEVMQEDSRKRRPILAKRMDGKIAKRAMEPRYTFAEAASYLGRPTSTVRRWSIGNPRKQRGERKRDAPLIAIDGDAGLPLSFLNLLELRFLASYRATVPLPAIRRALDYAGAALAETRPLVTAGFKAQGRSLFLRYAELTPDAEIDASRKGQLAWRVEVKDVWPSSLDAFLRAVDYDQEEGRAHRWWPLGRDLPIIIDTLYNGGRPSTALAGVRTNAIAVHHREGLVIPEIAYDVGASEPEVEAALEFEGLLAA
jgi:hypothetical protein